MLSWYPIRDGPYGPNLGHSLQVGAENFCWGGSCRGVLGDPETLDLPIWGGHIRSQSDCCIIFRVSGESPSILGRMTGLDGREVVHTGKVSWSQSGQSQGDVATNDGEVHPGGDAKEA